MDGLPDELIVTILRDPNLKLNDLVKCRRISKRFRFLIDNHVSVFIKELAVSGQLINEYQKVRSVAQSYYERFGRLQNENFHLKGSRFESLWFLKKPLSRNLFANLKCLTCNLKNEITNLEILNHFVQLESLIIEQKITLERRATLKLPRLKYLALDRIDSCSKRVFLRLKSKVQVLKVNFMGSELKLAYPGELRSLDINFLNGESKICSMKNLRVLKSRHFQRRKWNFLEYLLALEEVYIKTEFAAMRGELKALCEHLMKEKEILGRQNVRIYFCDVLLTKPFQSYGFERFEEHRYNITRLQIHHFKLLPDRVLESTNMYGTSYNLVTACLNEQKISLADYFRKYPNIQGVYVQQITNDEDLLFFLKQCSSLILLEFRDQCLVSQHIVNQLPDCCPRLKFLRLKDKLVGCQIDYSPLKQLKHLVKLTKTESFTH